MIEKTILLTGAAGNMGYEGLKLLVKNKKFAVKILALPDKTSRKKLLPFTEKKNVEIIWGNLTCYEDVLQAVGGSDYILHVGALVSPVADYYPVLTDKINYGGTLNIIKAVMEQPYPDKIHLVFIGSVAEVGDRLPPKHWERVGDPIRISQFDRYAASKVKAERAVMESGLKYWVSLRQTGMLHYNLLKHLDPILFHQPINTHIEWVTSEDSGRLLYNICEYDLPDEFWRKVYNIGGGASFRQTYDTFLTEIFNVLGVKNYKKIYNPKWFATKNFHCCWFEDSDRLNNFLHFRQQSFGDFLMKLKRGAPRGSTLLKFIPPALVKNLVMKHLASRKHGPLYWLKNNMQEKINAYWGSKRNWEELDDSWNYFARIPDDKVEYIDHGFNDIKHIEQIGIEDIKQAALFRGGRCLSNYMKRGDLYTPLEWECSRGHRFNATPYLVLYGGHWCPECDIDSARYTSIAEKNKFLAQVVFPDF